MKKQAFLIVYSLFITIGLIINFGIIDNSVNKLSYSGHFTSNVILEVVLMYFVYKLNIETFETSKKINKILIVLSLIFSAFIILGFIVSSTGNLNVINKHNCFKILWSYMSICLLLYNVGYLFFVKIFSLKISKDVEYNSCIDNNIMIISGVSLISIYSILLIISYPGLVIWSDFFAMVAQGFNIQEWTSDSLLLLKEGEYLNNYHPVAYTILVHYCILVGLKVFNSANIGVFILSFIQLMCFIFVSLFMIKVCIKEKIKKEYIAFLLIYLLFAPKIQNYVFFTTKDVLYANFMVAFILSIYYLIKNASSNAMINLVIWGTLAGLFRNDGKYIIVGSLLLVFILNNAIRNKLIISTACIVSLFSIYYGLFLPYKNITPASTREMLSVPFQQTARYVKYYGADLTLEEKNAIDKVLDVNSIGRLYNPELSDSVKGTYKKSASKEDIVDYLSCWSKMFFKQPKLYLESFLNNYYNYFYPGAKLVTSEPSFYWCNQGMQQVNNNDELKKLGVNLSYPDKSKKFRDTYEKVREKFFGLPILSFFRSTAAYVWSLIFFFSYFFYTQNKVAVSTLIPLLLSMMVCFLGPCNGDYFRYIYSIYLSLPFLILLGINEQKNIER